MMGSALNPGLLSVHDDNDDRRTQIFLGWNHSSRQNKVLAGNNERIWKEEQYTRNGTDIETCIK